MANYSIVSNAKFTPFSFDQMVKPFQMYGEYYTQQENTASQLAEEAAEWGKKANEATDPITYKKYKDFETDLNRQSNRLLRQGLTPGLRADIQKLKKRYATDISPIKDAYTWRLQQIQNQVEGKAKGMVYEGDAATTSLDKYMENPTLIYNAADSTTGYNRVANAAQAIAKGLSEAKITGKLDAYTNALLIRSGYDTSDVTGSISQAMNDLQGVLNGNISMNSKAGRVVQELLQNESRASGVEDWEDLRAKREYMSKVSPALYNLVGQSAITPTENYGARADKQLASTIAAQNNQARLSEQAADRQRAFTASLYGGTYDKATGTTSGVTLPSKKHSKSDVNTSSSNSKTSYSYDRPNTAFKDGKPSRTVSVDEATGVFTINGKATTIRSELQVKHSKKNFNDIEIWKDGRKIASYNTNNTGDGVLVYNPTTGKYNASHGGAKLWGVLTGVTAADIRNLARHVAENPGSENQYSYGVTEDGELYSIQNKAQRVTTDSQESADALSALLEGIGFAAEGTESNNSLDVWE